MTANVGDDESLYMFVVDAKWINLWKKFANGETSQPGPICNRQLVDKIMEKRARHGHLMHDNYVSLPEPADIFMLSQAFWQVFRDRYGCDVVV